MDRGTHIGGRYKLGEKLGSGSYGKYCTTLCRLFDVFTFHYLGKVYRAHKIGGCEDSSQEATGNVKGTDDPSLSPR